MPHQLRAFLCMHDTSTAVYIGLGGYKNGALLNVVEDRGFDVILTGDRSVQFQQNLEGRKIGMVVLSVNNWRILKHCIPKILIAVNDATRGMDA